jgi:VWFA-related protein
VARFSSLAVLMLLLSPGGHAARAQQRADAADASDSARPRTVSIEVLVTDKQGKPIVDVRPSDLTILENGVPQKVSDVSLHSRALPPVGPIATPSPVETPEDEVRAAREPGTRVIALYLDEYHVSAGADTERVRETLGRFVDEQLRPQDLVTVMKPLDHLTNIRFTRNRDVIRQAVASFSGRKGEYEPRTTFEEQYVGSAPAAIRAARAQIVMSGVRAVTSRIGELQGGLGGVVLVTEGFATSGSRNREMRLPDLQGLVRAASRAHSLFYALDPSVLPPAATSVASDAGDADADAMTALSSVAQQTGGQSLSAGHDLATALQQISHDLDTYYVVSFVSASGSDGRFHSVQLSSTRKGAQVRTRSGYWAPMPETRLTRSLVSPMPVTMRAVRRSPLIDSWLGMTIEPDGRRRMIFTWTPIATPPSVSRRLPVHADVVVLKVTTLSGAVLFDGEVRPARGPGMTAIAQRDDSATFLADPGRLQLDLTILQADGTKVDTGSQDFDVPQYRPGKPEILPAQLFRAASAREVREITADANAAPLPGREFRRTETLLLRVPTWDSSGADVTVSARLVNRVGSLVSEFTPVPLENRGKVTQFDLPLARFAPGEYSIEIAARSTSGVSRELIRVKITG